MFKIEKSPDAVLDYKFDWKASTNSTGTSNWLEDGETISTVEVTISPDNEGELEIHTAATRADTNTSVVVWFSGGVANDTYIATCKIVTTGGRTDTRKLEIQVKER